MQISPQQEPSITRPVYGADLIQKYEQELKSAVLEIQRTGISFLEQLLAVSEQGQFISDFGLTTILVYSGYVKTLTTTSSDYDLYKLNNPDIRQKEFKENSSKIADLSSKFPGRYKKSEKISKAVAQIARNIIRTIYGQVKQMDSLLEASSRIMSKALMLNDYEDPLELAIFNEVILGIPPSQFILSIPPSIYIPITTLEEQPAFTYLSKETIERIKTTRDRFDIMCKS